MSGGLINSPLHVYSSNILISLAESPLLFIMWPLSELDTTRLEEARGGPSRVRAPTVYSQIPGKCQAPQTNHFEGGSGEETSCCWIFRVGETHLKHSLGRYTREAKADKTAKERPRLICPSVLPWTLQMSLKCVHTYPKHVLTHTHTA